MLEKGPHVSFSNCSLPYHLSGIVPKSEQLVLMNPTAFKKRVNIDSRIHQEVSKINRDEKTVVVKDLQTGARYVLSAMSPGANPTRPNLEGVAKSHLSTVRNVTDVGQIQSYVQRNEVKNIALIGGGFIAGEVAENLRLAGHNGSLMEFANQ